MVKNCLNIEEHKEETLLRSMGTRKRRVLGDQTPKRHCDLAGEEMEYSWGDHTP
jgi:hypothetical protein